MALESPLVGFIFFFFRCRRAVVQASRIVTSVHAASAATHRLTGKIILSSFSFLLVVDSISFEVAVEELIESVEIMRVNNNLGKIKFSIWFDCLSLPSSWFNRRASLGH